jgi:hypothetical protein
MDESSGPQVSARSPLHGFTRATLEDARALHHGQLGSVACRRTRLRFHQYSQRALH